MLLIELFAEREGFEPPVPLGTVVFLYGGFQDRCNRPLYHLSNAFIIAGRSMCLKSECKGIKFFWFRQTFVVFFSNYFRFPYPYAGKVVTLQYDLP